MTYDVIHVKLATSGVLQKKIRTRAVFNETPTNYVSGFMKMVLKNLTPNIPISP